MTCLKEYFPEACLPEEMTKWLELCLDEAPEYFWTMPASTSGWYHSPEDNDKGGLIRHVRKTIIAAKELHQVYKITKEELDLIIAALVLHDTYRCGFTGRECLRNGSISTDNMHPLYPRTGLKKVTPKDSKDIDLVFRMIEGHYGIWSPIPTLYPVITNGMNREEILITFVHLCDMIASRSNIDVKLNS
jgi:hypothetical protein